MSLPYYFEVPEIELPFDVMKYVHQEDDLMEKDDQIFDGNSDYLDKLQQGRTASKEAGWYLQGFGGTGAEKTQGATLSESTGMTEEQNAEMSKLLREWSKDTFTLRMTSVSLLRTLPGQNGWWHCEGPMLRSRRCALNFLVEGELNKTKAEWGYCKLWGDIPPEQVEQKGYVKAEYVPEMEVYENGTYVSDVLNRGFFYNTMYLHRGVNENCNKHRTILSIALQENIDIHAVHKVYEQGKLFK